MSKGSWSSRISGLSNLFGYGSHNPQNNSGKDDKNVNSSTRSVDPNSLEHLSSDFLAYLKQLESFHAAVVNVSSSIDNMCTAFSQVSEEMIPLLRVSGTTELNSEASDFLNDVTILSNDVLPIIQGALSGLLLTPLHSLVRSHAELRNRVSERDKAIRDRDLALKELAILAKKMASRGSAASMRPSNVAKARMKLTGHNVDNEDVESNGIKQQVDPKILAQQADLMNRLSTSDVLISVLTDGVTSELKKVSLQRKDVVTHLFIGLTQSLKTFTQCSGSIFRDCEFPHIVASLRNSSGALGALLEGKSDDSAKSIEGYVSEGHPSESEEVPPKSPLSCVRFYAKRIEDIQDIWDNGSKWWDMGIASRSITKTKVDRQRLRAQLESWNEVPGRRVHLSEYLVQMVLEDSPAVERPIVDSSLCYSSSFGSPSSFNLHPLAVPLGSPDSSSSRRPASVDLTSTPGSGFAGAGAAETSNAAKDSLLTPHSYSPSSSLSSLSARSFVHPGALQAISGRVESEEVRARHLSRLHSQEEGSIITYTLPLNFDPQEALLTTRGWLRVLGEYLSVCDLAALSRAVPASGRVIRKDPLLWANSVLISSFMNDLDICLMGRDHAAYQQLSQFRQRNRNKGLQVLLNVYFPPNTSKNDTFTRGESLLKELEEFPPDLEEAADLLEQKQRRRAAVTRLEFYLTLAGLSTDLKEIPPWSVLHRSVPGTSVLTTDAFVSLLALAVAEAASGSKGSSAPLQTVSVSNSGSGLEVEDGVRWRSLVEQDVARSFTAGVPCGSVPSAARFRSRLLRSRLLKALAEASSSYNHRQQHSHGNNDDSLPLNPNESTVGGTSLTSEDPADNDLGSSPPQATSFALSLPRRSITLSLYHPQALPNSTTTPATPLEAEATSVSAQLRLVAQLLLTARSPLVSSPAVRDPTQAGYVLRKEPSCRGYYRRSRSTDPPSARGDRQALQMSGWGSSAVEGRLAGKQQKSPSMASGDATRPRRTSIGGDLLHGCSNSLQDIRRNVPFSPSSSKGDIEADFFFSRPPLPAFHVISVSPLDSVESSSHTISGASNHEEIEEEPLVYVPTEEEEQWVIGKRMCLEVVLMLLSASLPMLRYTQGMNCVARMMVEVSAEALGVWDYFDPHFNVNLSIGDAPVKIGVEDQKSLIYPRNLPPLIAHLCFNAPHDASLVDTCNSFNRAIKYCLSTDAIDSSILRPMAPQELAVTVLAAALTRAIFADEPPPQGASAERFSFWDALNAAALPKPRSSSVFMPSASPVNPNTDSVSVNSESPPTIQVPDELVTGEIKLQLRERNHDDDTTSNPVGDVNPDNNVGASMFENMTVFGGNESESLSDKITQSTFNVNSVIPHAPTTPAASSISSSSSVSAREVTSGKGLLSVALNLKGRIGATLSSSIGGTPSKAAPMRPVSSINSASSVTSKDAARRADDGLNKDLDSCFNLRLSALFHPSMACLRLRNYQFERLLLRRVPQFHFKFSSERVSISSFSSPLILTVFSGFSAFTSEFAARAWDSALVGGWSSVFRLLLALVLELEPLVLRTPNVENCIMIMNSPRVFYPILQLLYLYKDESFFPSPQGEPDFGLMAVAEDAQDPDDDRLGTRRAMGNSSAELSVQERIFKRAANDPSCIVSPEELLELELDFFGLFNRDKVSMGVESQGMN